MPASVARVWVACGMHLLDVAIATPATMTPDAYREFCWGPGLDETPTGYGLIRGVDLDDTVKTIIVNDPQYALLIRDAAQASDESIVLAAEKVHTVITEWPCLRSDAPSVW